MDNMCFLGLLTDEQKRAGYFITQTLDFVFLWYGKNTDQPEIVAIWLYNYCRIKDVRDKAEEHMNKT